MKWFGKNMPVIAMGMFLTAVAIRKAYTDRGYLAYGGEYLILPMLLASRKFVSDIKEVFAVEVFTDEDEQ